MPLLVVRLLPDFVLNRAGQPHLVRRTLRRAPANLPDLCAHPTCNE
jgi:hypothetical protein